MGGRASVGSRGEPAEQVVVSHPAAWGAYRRELLHRALWEIGLADVTLLPEPVVAAESHAARGLRGRTFGVYSLGGSDYEASVVRWAEGIGFQLLGSAGAIEPFGGADVDEALVDHVRSRLDRDLREVFARGPQARIALYGLRRECRRVKEELTSAAAAEVVLSTSHGHVRVPVTRAELEELVRPALELSVETLAQVIRSCGLRRRELDGMLLVGGAARMPLVAELLRAALPGPVGLEAEPQSTAAAGAALAAVQVVSPRGAWRQDPMWIPEQRAIEASNHEPPPFVQEGMDAGPPPRPPVEITPLRLRPTQRLFGLVGGQA
ncbi:Hsp70 family protein [Phytohabitans houttuyneae]|uniref:Hsp70 family protein n=1 Tax=Phytohabitans houttuyneae TaxID=1076126 RepID=UPI0024838614|nr:Hsp70 family protein [Phytohabitans houttuyneae]